VKIDFSSLPSCPAVSRNLLPNISAIYFLLDRDECIYIGKSINLRNRWAAHETLENVESLDRLRIAWKPVAESDLDTEECALINELRPILNRRFLPIPETPSHQIAPGLALRLDQLLYQRNRSLYWLAGPEGANVDYNSLWRLKEGRSKSISFDLLNRICNALNCTAADLFEHIPDKKKPGKKGIDACDWVITRYAWPRNGTG
jgi:DNA-binding Xre family transcriptional regulator